MYVNVRLKVGSFATVLNSSLPDYSIILHVLFFILFSTPSYFFPVATYRELVRNFLLFLL